MPFNIGSQQAGVINNVEGNQTIHGGQTGNAVTDSRALLDRVRQELAALPLPIAITSRVYPELDAVDAELGAPQPNQPAAISRLGRIIGTLKSAGALATTGSGLLASLTALVRSFGELGRPLLHLLGA
jgi:hypothetical protein